MGLERHFLLGFSRDLCSLVGGIYPDMYTLYSSTLRLDGLMLCLISTLYLLYETGTSLSFFAYMIFTSGVYYVLLQLTIVINIIKRILSWTSVWTYNSGSSRFIQ